MPVLPYQPSHQFTSYQLDTAIGVQAIEDQVDIFRILLTGVLEPCPKLPVCLAHPYSLAEAV